MAIPLTSRSYDMLTEFNSGLCLCLCHLLVEEFSMISILIFFHLFSGIGCDVDREKALEFYLLAINNEVKE